MPKAQHLNKYFKLVLAKNGFDKYLSNVKFIQADQGNCVATVKVTENDLNAMGRLHSGFSTTLIDSISGYGLTTLKDCSKLCVTVNINVAFINAAKVGDEIKIVTNVLKAGKSMVYLDIELFNLKSNELFAKAKQTMIKV